jgi:membrane protease YdiL (CAAX protease family)
MSQPPAPPPSDEDAPAARSVKWYAAPTTEGEPPPPNPAPPMPSAGRALATAAVVTVVVTLVSWFAPKSVAATGVGLVFLAATWFSTIRREDGDAGIWGISLGGLLDRERISYRRVIRETAIALAWAAALALVFFAPFYFGYRLFWQPRHAFMFRLPSSIVDDIAGQLFVIALPEEAFFRGYLQTALESAWRPKLRILGAELGLGWLVSAAVFAVGHVLTTPSPARLAVFFPALVFGYLRARTRGIGAGVAFHAACNIYSATLARGFGMPT